MFYLTVDGDEIAKVLFRKRREVMATEAVEVADETD